MSDRFFKICVIAILFLQLVLQGWYYWTTDQSRSNIHNKINEANVKIEKIIKFFHIPE